VIRPLELRQAQPNDARLPSDCEPAAGLDPSESVFLMSGPSLQNALAEKVRQVLRVQP
jgi:hypothetical protein